jgi:hypothetical protein
MTRWLFANNVTAQYARLKHMIGPLATAVQHQVPRDPLAAF